MTQEDKQLLLQDLSARLPYGVKFLRESWNYEWDQELSVIEVLEDIDKDGYINNTKVYNVEDIKPYLRPMSSMTEEEKSHISKMMCLRTYDDGIVYDMTYPVYTPYYVMEDCLNYLRSIHIDYSGLIERGLALVASEGMYKLKEK